MSYATSAHAVFDQTLAMLDGLLTKAAAHEAGDALLAEKLADDMLPLGVQVQFVSHQVTNTLNRLAASDYAAAETDPATIAEARTHIADLRAMIADHPAASWVKSDTRVSFNAGSDYLFESEAHEYVRDWVMPNFYFHATTAYAILRSKGLDIGKADFVPHMMRYLKTPAS